MSGVAKPTCSRAFRVAPGSISGAAALVTGAGRGIGVAAACALAAAGASEIVLMSRTRAELEEVAAQVEGLGARARVEVCDVRDGAAVRAVVESLPRLDILVNNAGTNILAMFVDVTEPDLDAMLSLNVRAVILVAQAAARKMLSSSRPANMDSAAIINITSQMGRVGAPRRTIYCATKHAVEGLTKALAVELAPFGIRVNAVAPTFIATPLTDSLFAKDPSLRQWVLDRIPMGRIGTVEEVAALIAFLASPAASLITGESIAVDGGWTAQ
jgi:NAD(P)-dependent dehydrogenase (short-subunit alcohol dehydrogenase family)